MDRVAANEFEFPDGARYLPAQAATADRTSHDPVFGQTSRKELWMLGLYFLTVIALCDVLNVRPGVELMTCAVILAALAITRRPRLFLHDWWFYLLGLVLWNVSGPIAAQSPFPWHLDFMLNLDRALFFGHDPVVLVQHALARPGHIGPLDVASVVAYNMHLPEPYIAGYFLWRLNRAVYLQFAASVLILLVAGLATFILFPAVPPWMASSRFGKLPDVVNLFGPILRAHPLPFHGTPLFYVFQWRGDPVAAFPSEHAALPLLECLAFSRVAGRIVSVLFLLWVAWILFAILYLGEHWVTDALAGWAYALVIFWSVRRFALHRVRH